jgi:stearoyl-CoA desaturase (delta-9 desaturase)
MPGGHTVARGLLRYTVATGATYCYPPKSGGAGEIVVRIFFVHHVTWSVNSVCHFFGSRRFDIDDHSTNVGWLSVLSLGESWHHNHHAFPRSAYHGLRRWEVDPSGLIIAGMQKVGLAWNVVRISPERQRARAVVAS